MAHLQDLTQMSQILDMLANQNEQAIHIFYYQLKSMLMEVKLLTVLYQLIFLGYTLMILNDLLYVAQNLSHASILVNQHSI